MEDYFGKLLDELGLPLEYRQNLIATLGETIRVTVTRGEYPTKEKLCGALDCAGVKYKPQNFDYPEFVISPDPISVDLVIVRVEQFGFTVRPSYREIIERAQFLTLQLCEPEIGPLLRLRHKSQARGETMYVGMNPISSDQADIRTPYPFIFSVARSSHPDDPLLLDDPFVLGETKKYDLSSLFVFTLANEG